MSIMIKNLRTSKPTQPWQVRVDRASVLGNPYYMHNELERDKVCDSYYTYFLKQLPYDTAFTQELSRLLKLYEQYGKLELFCWCAPKRCHAETIREHLLAEYAWQHPGEVKGGK